MGGSGALGSQERAVVQRRPQSDRRRLYLRLQEACAHHDSNVVKHADLQDDLPPSVMSVQLCDNSALIFKLI